MADNARGIHVSPGIYSKETEISYAVKSLGITTLGLVGETLKGPAFQPMMVENWRGFQDTFGGTSTEKFAGSQYPKYELPYIAKSYLTESNQLQVCRVLGLGGYNAGPAWVIKAVAKDTDSPYNNMAVAVLRSRGHYEKVHQYEASGSCDCQMTVYDKLFYEVGEQTMSGSEHCSPTTYNNVVKLGHYSNLQSSESGCEGYSSLTPQANSGTTINVSSVDHGHFKICGLVGPQATTATVAESATTYFEYAVSLNPSDKDYILKVFDRDRLICECIKHENKMDREIYNKAIQAYIHDGKKNITNLLDYAKRRNIHKKVRERIGVWL